MTLSLDVVVSTSKSLQLGAKASFDMLSPVRSMNHRRVKFLVSHTVIVFALELILAKKRSSGEKLRLK